ncbi:MAG: FHA domain-containing protein [Pseudomonadales bacterium]|nr:FHA domain-containing protein [Pseudomonadales bacterium]
MPLTKEARQAIKDAPCLEISRFPFLIGREQRAQHRNGHEWIAERRKYDGPPVNHCYLIDNCDPLYISREHLALNHLGEQRFSVIDRESACGTIVHEQLIGGHDKGGNIDLSPDQIIQIGSRSSPYLFRFELD